MANNEQETIVAQQLEASLEVVVEKYGDITPIVLERYYECHPEAKQLFKDLGYHQAAELECSMVESTLYCLMHLTERPVEIEVMLASTVPHHDALKIPKEFFVGLVEATVDVVVSAFDISAKQFIDLWSALKSEMLGMIQKSTAT